MAAFSKWKAAGVLVLALGGHIALAQPALAPNAGQKLRGHVPSAVNSLQPLHRLDGTRELSLSIGLPLRNQQMLTNLLQQIYDPASPNFHKYLDPEQFTLLFGPTEQDYQAVIDFAASNHLKVTGTNSSRTLLDVSGPVAAIESALGVVISVYNHPRDPRTFYAPDSEPTLNLAVKILHISGLTDYVIPRPAIHRPAPGHHEPPVSPATGSSPGGSYLGYDFRKAYLPDVQLTGTGQAVALFELDGYFASDIASYKSQAGLPNVPLQNVLIDSYNGAAGANNVEVALDIEMAIAMAPGLSKVIVYEGLNNGNDTIITHMLSRIASDNSSKQISSSWLIGDNPSWDQIYLQYALQGQSFFQASGDNDAFVWNVDGQQRTDDPNITLVGGTTLFTHGPGGAWQSETVWNVADGEGSGGGISPNYSIPVWQLGVNMSAGHGSTTMRNIPDVALTADNIFVVADNGANIEGVGGTSAAAPLWAAFTALVNQQALAGGLPTVGFINPAVYAIGKGQNYASDFRDTTTGDNRWSGSPGLFPAVAGYDLCTGWGTPAGQNLINALTFAGTPDGILEVSITPPDGSTLLEGSSQNVSVLVTDALPVTNATVVATINGTNLSFPSGATRGFYSANVSVPSNTNDLILNFLITAPGKTNSTNVVTYSVVPTPPNDYFTNATKVPPDGAFYLANNKFATLEKGEPSPAGDTNAAASLWWNWSPSSSTNVFIDTVGSQIDTVLAVYTGPSISNLIQVAATNDVGLSQQAYLSFNATGGASYRITVASANSNSVGSLRLRIAPGGQPDTNPPTVVVTSPLSGAWLTNFLMTISGTAYDPQPNASGVSRVLVSVNGQLPLTALGTTNWSSTFGLIPGLNTFRVTAVDFAGNASQPAVVQVYFVAPNPPNDTFANALSLVAVPQMAAAVTTNATKEFDEPDHAGNAGGKSVWWWFQPPADGALSLTTSNSTFDTLLGVYTGSVVSNLTTIASNDDAYPGALNGFSALTVAVHSNQTYYIAVDGFGGASGNVSLGYTFTPTPLFTLTIDSAGGGQVTGPAGDVVSNSTVLVTGTPDPFYVFDGWTGSFPASANPLSIVATSNIALTAHFRAISYTDDFETGNLQKINWVTSGNLPWVVESSVVLAGNYSARSGAIGNSQTSSLMFTTNFGGGTASFYFKVSSEPTWDVFGFYVDGVRQQQWSGEVDWTSYSFPLAGGTHTLEWRYTKDSTFSDGLDAVFIDNVSLPLSVGIDASTPAHLQMVPQADGSLLLVVTGQTNQQYVIQGATSLTPPIVWQDLSTSVATGGVINYVDPGTSTNPIRFYRAIVRP